MYIGICALANFIVYAVLCFVAAAFFDVNYREAEIVGELFLYHSVPSLITWVISSIIVIVFALVMHYVYPENSYEAELGDKAKFGDKLIVKLDDHPAISALIGNIVSFIVIAFLGFMWRPVY